MSGGRSHLKNPKTMTQDCNRSPHVTFADDPVESLHENCDVRRSRSAPSSSARGITSSSQDNYKNPGIRRLNSPTSAVRRKSSLSCRKNKFCTSNSVEGEVLSIKESDEQAKNIPVDAATDAKDRISPNTVTQCVQVEADATEAFLLLRQEFSSTYSWIPPGVTSRQQVS